MISMTATSVGESTERTKDEGESGRIKFGSRVIPIQRIQWDYTGRRCARYGSGRKGRVSNRD